MNWIGQAVRFGVVGIGQNALNVATFAAGVALGVQYQSAAVIAGLVAFVVSFVLNRRWTFSGRATPMGRQGVRYLIVFATAIALGLILLTFLVEVAHMPEVAAQIAAILIVAPISFLVQRSWVFRPPPTPASLGR